MTQSWRDAALASFDEAWQTVNDTFYDPAFGGLNWPSVKAELRPRAEQASTPDAARAVISEMLARLKRSHFGLLSSSSADALPGPASAPIEVRVGAEGVLITEVREVVAQGAGGKRPIDLPAGAGPRMVPAIPASTVARPGQTVLAVDGHDVAELMRGTESLDPRARHFEIWRRVNRVLHGTEGSVAVLRVRDVTGPVHSIQLKRVMPEGEAITVGNLPPLQVQFEQREYTSNGGHRVGFIHFNIWMTPEGDRIADAVDKFRHLDGIVIDVRGNPGGLPAMMGGVAGHFIAEPVELGTMRTRQTTLKFSVNPRLVTTDGRKVDVFRGPLGILIDELTGSASETFVGSMQGLGRARVFGRQSMGQALPALTKRLPNGDVLIYAIGDYTTSSGRSLEGSGVVPDIAIPLSARVLASGRDAVLEAALKWVDGQI